MVFSVTFSLWILIDSINIESKELPEKEHFVTEIESSQLRGKDESICMEDFICNTFFDTSVSSNNL